MKTPNLPNYQEWPRQLISESGAPRLACSVKTTADILDCSPDFVRELMKRGVLERAQLSTRRCSITSRSILRLVFAEVE
jgi:hypothetical protein